jgi:hypothetical protein
MYGFSDSLPPLDLPIRKDAGNINSTDCHSADVNASGDDEAG